MGDGVVDFVQADGLPILVLPQLFRLSGFEIQENEGLVGDRLLLLSLRDFLASQLAERFVELVVAHGGVRILAKEFLLAPLLPPHHLLQVVGVLFDVIDVCLRGLQGLHVAVELVVLPLFHQLPAGPADVEAAHVLVLGQVDLGVALLTALVPLAHGGHFRPLSPSHHFDVSRL